MSKEQIIWGGNYFRLPPNRCFIVWDKTNIPENFTLSMAEYAWCSMNGNAKIVRMSSANQENRWHPTAKPVKLYEWIYSRYAKEGYKILDTHLGSGNSRIAAWDSGLNLEFTGFEIDREYFEREEAQFEKHISQLDFFHMSKGGENDKQK